MPWDPLSEAARRPHLTVATAPLPRATGGAVWWRRGARAVIVIDPRLTGPDRVAALAHELVHDERGAGADAEGMPPAWQAVVARDEAVVDREVARRLVPPDELAARAAASVDAGETVTAADVAEWFDVPLSVAERAARTLTARP